MSEQKFIEALSQYRTYDGKIKKLQGYQEKLRGYIHGYVKKNGSQEYDGSKCFIQDRSKIVYDIEKIKGRFGKRAKRFLADRLSFDTSFFISICKQEGIDYHLFLKKGCFDREEKVDEKALSKLVDMDEISYEDLKGCYTVEEKDSIVIRLN